MTRPPSTRFSLPQVGSTLLLGALALLILGLQPILLDELVSDRIITMEGVGIIAMGEIVALGLGVTIGDLLLSLARYRSTLIISALLVALLDLLTAQAHGDLQFTLLRIGAGLAEGVLVWGATSVIVRASNPGRLTALFMVWQTLLQSSTASALASWVLPGLGWRAGFQVLALTAVLAALLPLALPRQLQPLAAPTEARLKWSSTCLLPLAVAFCQMAGIGALWMYLEPIGVAHGLPASQAHALISTVLLMQVAGGVMAIWLVRHLPLVATLTIGALVLAAISAAIYLMPGHAPGAFRWLSHVFGFAWLFLMPFHVPLAFRADDKGRVAVLVPAAQLLGSAFGPLVASLVVSGENTAWVPLVSFAFAAAMMLMMVVGRKRWSRHPLQPQDTYTGATG